MTDPQSVTLEQVEAAQELLNEHGFGHWFVNGVAGNHADPIARFSAQRIIPGGRAFSVLHDDPKVLLELAREADARFNDSPQSVVVVSGNADTSTHGGA
jgi:hypothetical protein